eukprot:8070713-Pyramimonas_sp.AAC.1
MEVVRRNARSLTTDDRIQGLIAELHSAHWDFALINETWRTTATELWTTTEGHTFAGSGNDQACHGVLILAHKRRGK